MIFLYQVQECILIHEKTHRELRGEYPQLEILRQFHTIQDALTFLESYTGCVINMVKKTFMGITPAGREMMREKKRGHDNPNAQGLSESHRQKIQVSMKKHRKKYPDHHGMLHRSHTLSSRRKISIGMRNIPPRKWCVDEHGHEHFVDAKFVLPIHWVWGRSRHHVRS